MMVIVTSIHDLGVGVCDDGSRNAFNRLHIPTIKKERTYTSRCNVKMFALALKYRLKHFIFTYTIQHNESVV
jgi:hypothetical protein